MKKIIIIIIISFSIAILILLLKREFIKENPPPFYLFEKTIIVNEENNNFYEGRYLKVFSGGGTTQIKVKGISNIKIDEVNTFGKWLVGWGSSVPLYDAGVENIREIKSIDKRNDIITLGALLRGQGFPKVNQRIVLLNRYPSGFVKLNTNPIFDHTSGFKNFAGKSIMYSTIIKDSAKWIMYLNEVDTDNIKIYAATTTNLINWNIENNGNPILTAKDFENTLWAGKSKDGKTPQSALLTDVIKHNGKWFFIMNGYNKNHKRNIGIAITKNPINGPFEIMKEPVITEGKSLSFDEKGVFYGKVVKDGNKFLMFYDGINKNDEEALGMASSNDLLKWEKYENNPVIVDHNGWRSRSFCSEPAFVKKEGKYIMILLAGSKNFKLGWFHHYITKRMYMDVSGNVDDIQLGLYYSSDGGKSFKQHPNNPLMINDYADVNENEHMGGSINFIQKNDTLFMFYTAKTINKNCSCYHPFVRYKKLKKIK